MGVHAIGLLPNVTGSVVHEILKQRDIKKFNDLGDLKTRVPSFKNPQKAIVLKIKEELGLIESKRMRKYYLFTNVDSNI